MLEGLARLFEVHLLVVPASGGSLDVPDFVRELTARVGVLDLADCVDTHAALIGRVDDAKERRRQRVAYPRPWAARSVERPPRNGWWNSSVTRGSMPCM